jgi:hypothetical protein
MHVDVLSEFQGSRFSNNGGLSYAAWDRLLDADLGKCGSAKMRTLNGVIEERMVTPLTAPPSTAAFGACYSAILFGPPGTAKTTICEALAKRMGWDFLVIDTSVFLADGLSNVASRIRYVFQRLQSLQNCVILFDEIEEFCLDRETPGLGMESRMLTTAMLTAINDLRSAENSVFFLATNRLRAFDSAITRPGRFDGRSDHPIAPKAGRCSSRRRPKAKSLGYLRILSGIRVVSRSSIYELPRGIAICKGLRQCGSTRPRTQRRRTRRKYSPKHTQARAGRFTCLDRSRSRIQTLSGYEYWKSASLK